MLLKSQLRMYSSMPVFHSLFHCGLSQGVEPQPVLGQWARYPSAFPKLPTRPSPLGNRMSVYLRELPLPFALLKWAVQGC